MMTLLQTDIGVSYSDVSALIITVGGILAIVGATLIYRKWTSGKQDIEQDVMLWVGGIVVLIIIQMLVKMMFNGYV